MSKMSELSQALDEMVACGEGLIRTAKAIREMFSEEPATAEQAPAEEAAPALQEEQPKAYTFAEVRKAFSAKSHAGFTGQIKELIEKYGADRLSAVNEEDYGQLMKDLEAIG